MNYIVSDIHGHFKELKNALDNAGFDENNPEHKLIVLGDMFDRGSESLSIYLYLKRLTDKGSAVVLVGNHEEMYINYLNGSSTNPFNYINNGVNETFADFWHRTAPFESWCLIDVKKDPTYRAFKEWLQIVRKDINEEYPDLLPWLENLPNYYEVEYENGKKYIMTHGILDTEALDWKNPTGGWHNCIWGTPEDITTFNNNTGATVIVGHINSGHIRNILDLPNGKQDNSILYLNDYGQDLYIIDTCTTITKEINVLIIDKNGEVVL